MMLVNIRLFPNFRPIVLFVFLGGSFQQQQMKREAAKSKMQSVLSVVQKKVCNSLYF